MMRILLSLVFTLAMWSSAATAAGAHGADLKAFLTLESSLLTSGAAGFTIELLDFYDNPVPSATMKAEVRLPHAASGLSASLSEIHPGSYAGQLLLPGPGPVDLWVEALFPGVEGPWRGGIKLDTGSGTPSNQRIVRFALRHDEPLIKPLGALILGLTLLAIVGSAGVFAVDTYRHAKGRV